jgi:hypothetical protein
MPFSPGFEQTRAFDMAAGLRHLPQDVSQPGFRKSQNFPLQSQSVNIIHKLEVINYTK